MDKSNQEELRHWVESQTAYLAPPADWQPDADAARERMHERMRITVLRRPPSVWTKWATAAAVPIAAFLLFSAGRIAADIWQAWTVRQVAVIEVNPWPEGVPSPAVQGFGPPIPPIPARDAEEARWRVKFEPRLPLVGVLSGTPKLSTTFGVGAGTVIHTADLGEALRKVGVTDQTVPTGWDGARIALHSSALVIAEWPDVVLVQSLPLTLTAPPGFDFAAFSAIILRILGVGQEEAQQLAQQAGTTPPWLAPLNRKTLRDRGKLETIQLRSGRATMLEEDSDHRITIVWMVPDRAYLLSGSISRDLAIAAANAIE